MSADSQQYVLFFGGASDAKNKHVKAEYERLHKQSYFGRAAVLKYFSHMDKGDAMRFLQNEVGRNARIALIGHSYGGDTAYLVARDTSVKPIDCLVTIDPVSRWTFGISKPAKVKKWINVWVEGFQNASDIVAVLGGHWGKTTGAENYKVSNVSHANFSKMLQPHLRTVKTAIN